MNRKLLVIDDDRIILDLVRDVFSDEDIEVLLENDGERALEVIGSQRPNVAVIDINLPRKSGLEILREIKQADPGVAVIITTGFQTTQNAIEAMKDGAYDYLTKPFDPRKLRDVVHKAFECSFLNRKVLYMKEPALSVEEDADIMIGSTPEMVEIWKQIGKVADSGATVLIQGESGTGKELLARALYENSSRRTRPFLAVNCAAIPETLLESELFGHEKGAFTDAVTRRIGKFEQCDGGTIFLDEIGEMSLGSQGKLLRVLENREFQRVGGNETIAVDVRVISATNQDLLQAVKEKRFRQDLYYRLRVVSILLPPLRERRDDIPLLANLFLKQISRSCGKTMKGIAPEAMKLLMELPWEGNIRELRNVINSALVFSKGEVLMPEDFGGVLEEGRAAAAPPRSNGATDDFHTAFGALLDPAFDAICRKNRGQVYETITSCLDRVLIEMAMNRTGHNQVLASRILGISRNTLRDRLERYGIGVDRSA